MDTAPPTMETIPGGVSLLKIMMRRFQTRRLAAMLAWASLATAAAVAALLVADRVATRLFPGVGGLVFPPRTVVVYETDEFRFEGVSNSKGYRGQEVARVPTQFRILALGDSFTYGWGADEDETWPAILQRLMTASGVAVDIINAGKSGVGTAEYAAIARRAIPALKPDLVLIGILQGDDLAQAVIGSHGPVTFKERARQALRTYTPELWSYWEYLQAEPVVHMRQIWLAEAAELLADVNAIESGADRPRRARFRSSLASGNLNPGLVSLAQAYPGYFDLTNKLNSVATRNAISDIASHIREIRRTGPEVLVVSIPHPVYVSLATQATYRNFGFDVDPKFAETDAMDTAIEQAAILAGVHWISLTTCVRGHHSPSDLFFPRDGHPTPTGYAFFARCMMEHATRLTPSRAVGTQHD